jgi:hypothetical protein
MQMLNERVTVHAGREAHEFVLFYLLVKSVNFN